MKIKFILTVILLVSITAKGQDYVPSEAINKARHEFQDMKYGMFIHWGASSLLGDGEWVMNNRRIRVNEYKRLLDFFNPQKYNAAEWVSLAKQAGMKYITFITRHHDGFSNWDTKASDWKITNTPYGKDVLKQLADECSKQGIKLGLYYSTLDWFRDDYPHETGRTGQHSGRKTKGDYEQYLNFVKTQLTELLTDYGPIAMIWFDGHWDQTNPEGEADRKSRIDWKYEEIYSLIHRLQPGCLIGNNHHLSPLSGEDFQMFEKDLPGENKAGLSFQKPSEALPLETCETLNNSWGFNITDTNYKTVKQVIQYLVNAAGRNANLLLNIGPMPNGAIQQEFVDTLLSVGEWLQANGKTIYGTRGFLQPAEWGVATNNANHVYLHILKRPISGEIMIENFPKKISHITVFGTDKRITYKNKKTLVITLPNNELNETDYILDITCK